MTIFCSMLTFLQVWSFECFTRIYFPFKDRLKRLINRPRRKKDISETFKDVKNLFERKMLLFHSKGGFQVWSWNWSIYFVFHFVFRSEAAASVLSVNITTFSVSLSPKFDFYCDTESVRGNGFEEKLAKPTILSWSSWCCPHCYGLNPLEMFCLRHPCVSVGRP